MSLIPSFFIDTVVAIGYETTDNRIMWSASGFFYFHTLNGNEGRTYLISNKHVFANKSHIYLRINPLTANEPKGYLLPIVNTDTEEILWQGHTSDNVDVAVIPINFNIFQEEGMKVSYFYDKGQSMNSKMMQDSGVFEGDSVFVLGFPISIVGDSSNSVVVRGGIISRIKDSYRNNQTPFLIDTTVFPGNSGGPVINKPELVGIDGTKTVSSANLIGIIASYIPYQDVAVSQQTNRPRIIFEENSGLSNVFTVDCIDEAIDQYEKQINDIITAEPEKSKKAEEESLENNIDSSIKIV